MFSSPVAIRLPDGTTRDVASVRKASELLMDVDWPGERDDRHEAALDACLKVLDGHRSVEDGREAFMEAARSAGILAG